MRSKTYRAVKEKLPATGANIADAVVALKEHPRRFDETVEVHVRLGIDPKKSDQMVRGTVQLPAGTAKAKRVAVFTEDPAKQAAAKEAGASVVGGAEVISDIEGTGTIDADVCVATPDMMPKIAKVARILGPKGLMPNPKTGTVSPDPAAAVRELMGGKVSFKMDQLGNIHESVAKLSWEADKISANVSALLDAIRAAKPTAAKGQFIRSVTLKSTMSPGIRVQA